MARSTTTQKKTPAKAAPAEKRKPVARRVAQVAAPEAPKEDNPAVTVLMNNMSLCGNVAHSMGLTMACRVEGMIPGETETTAFNVVASVGTAQLSYFQALCVFLSSRGGDIDAALSEFASMIGPTNSKVLGMIQVMFPYKGPEDATVVPEAGHVPSIN